MWAVLLAVTQMDSLPCVLLIMEPVTLAPSRIKYVHFISPCIAELINPSPHSLIESAGIVSWYASKVTLTFTCICFSRCKGFFVIPDGYF